MTGRQSMEPYTFDAELSLARMAVGFAARHKDDQGVSGLIHQVRRLESRYREGGLHDRADKLANILAWWDAGAPPSNDRVVLSFEEQQSIPPPEPTP
jgi:hypothetical protein